MLLFGSVSTSFAQGAWTKQVSGTTRTLGSVAWTGTQLVAVGDSGAVLTSPDGITWASRSSGSTAVLEFVTWTGSQLIAVGRLGTILTSQDGVTWTPRTSGITGNLISVTWTGSQFVAVGRTTLARPNDTGIVMTSPDGVNWTSRAYGIRGGLNSVTWTGSQLVAVGYTYTVNGNITTTRRLVATSPDGVMWTSTSSSTSSLNKVIWTGNGLIAVGDNAILTSPDGTTWTARFSIYSQTLWSVVSTGTLYVTVGSSGTVLNSLDGVIWTARNSGVTDGLYSITWTGAQFVSVGPAGTIHTSPRETVSPAPLLTAPAQNAMNISTAPTLTWGALPEAASYRLQVSTDSGFTTILVDDSTLTTPTRAIGPLEVNTGYYWRVNGKNTAGTGAFSAIWNFTTASTISIPAPPKLASPTDNFSGFGSTYLTWNASIGATSYRIQMSTDSTFSTTLIDDSTVTGTSRFSGNVQLYTYYYWRVNAKNTSGTSAYSEVWRFTSAPDAISPQVLAHQQLKIEAGNILRFFLPHRTRVIIQLFDSQGRMLSQLLNETRDAGYYNLPLSNELRGSYYLDFRAGGYHRSLRYDPSPTQ